MAFQARPVSMRDQHTSSDGRLGALTIVTMLFFMWGFITALNDILIPHLKPVFDLTYPQILFIQTAFFGAYFVFALPSGKLVDVIGYRKTMVTALIVMAIGALLFIPAASLPSFPFFLFALIVLAAGVTALQTSANPYVAVLGPPQTASSRLNLTQAFNSLGTTLAPPIGGLLILSATSKKVEELRLMAPSVLHDYRVAEAGRVKVPYLIIAIVLLCLAGLISVWKLPTLTLTSDFRTSAEGDGISLWKRSHLMLGVAAIFLYVGAEVSIGSFLVNYLGQSYIAGLAPRVAAIYVSLYWGGAMVGRFIGAGLMQKIRANVILAIAAGAATLLVLTSVLTFGHTAMWAIILVGLFNSIMFPTIFTLATAGLGPLTGRGSGLLVAGIVGGAIVPLLQGWLAERIGLHHAFLLPILCYAFIGFYGVRGYLDRDTRELN